MQKEFKLLFSPQNGKTRPSMHLVNITYWFVHAMEDNTCLCVWTYTHWEIMEDYFCL